MPNLEAARRPDDTWDSLPHTLTVVKHLCSSTGDRAQGRLCPRRGHLPYCARGDSNLVLIGRFMAGPHSMRPTGESEPASPARVTPTSFAPSAAVQP